MRKLVLLAVTALLASCATTTTAPINKAEPRRVVGTDNDVRLDAEIAGDQLQRTMTLPVRYEITNGRKATIAVADMLLETSYDPDTATVMIGIGSEVPGATLLPRLIAIEPGEKKSFTATARINLPVPLDSPVARIPRAIQVKLNFLADTKDFEQLIAMTEKGLYDPKLADDLFPKWIERNQTVFTNTLPMRWVTAPAEEPSPASRRGRRERGQ